jgi:hypothetical protein
MHERTTLVEGTLPKVETVGRANSKGEVAQIWQVPYYTTLKGRPRAALGFPSTAQKSDRRPIAPPYSRRGTQQRGHARTRAKRERARAFS